MDVKEFFYNGGVVKCNDRTESDVVIDILRAVGLPVFPSHNPDGNYHGVVWDRSHDIITFALNGESIWMRGVPFAEWMEQYGNANNPIPVEDLL